MQHLLEKTGLSWLFTRKTVQHADDTASDTQSRHTDSTLRAYALEDSARSPGDCNSDPSNPPSIQALLPLSHWIAKACRTMGSEQASEGANQH